MSRTAVIVAVLVMLILGGVAYFLTRPAPAAPTGPLFTFDPAAASELRVEFQNGQVQSVKRLASGEWQVTIAKSGQPARSWPASTTQVHSALRLLSSITTDRPAEGDFKDPEATLKVVAGSTPSLTFSKQRLAGRVLVQGADKRIGWVDAQLADMLVTTGPQAWRNAAALPGVGTDASRISLEAHNGAKLKLARTQGKWGLREPFAEPVNSDQVAKLLQVLNSVRITDFCDSGPPPASGLDKPMASLAVELDSRDAAGVSTTTRYALIVGQAADIAGKTVVARLEKAVGKDQVYSEVMIVSGDELAAINSDPISYLNRQAVDTPASDLGQLTVTRFPGTADATVTKYVRSPNGWDEERPTGKVTVPLAETKAIAAMLELLSTTAAESLSLSKESPDKPAAAIELASAGGTPIGSVSITIQGTKLIVTGTRIQRDYAAGVGAAVAEWLGRR